MEKSRRQAAPASSNQIEVKSRSHRTKEALEISCLLPVMSTPPDEISTLFRPPEILPMYIIDIFPRRIIFSSAHVRHGYFLSFGLPSHHNMTP